MRETVHQREDPPPDDPAGRAGRNAELDGGRTEKRKEINLFRNGSSRSRASDVRLFREFSFPFKILFDL